MKSLVLLCVEDEPEVRDALIRDLEPFESIVRIEIAEDVDDARSVVQSCLDMGLQIALVLCDHLLPGMNGVDYLVEMNQQSPTVKTRKVLVTGQAGLEDTVRAVNEANLEHYIAKPWTPEGLHAVVKKQLTDYVIQNVEDLLPYVSVLDGARILEALSGRAADT